MDPSNDRHNCATCGVSCDVACSGAKCVGAVQIVVGGGTAVSSADPVSPQKVASLAWVTSASDAAGVTCATRRNGVLSCWGGGDDAAFPSDTRNAVEVVGIALAPTGACLRRRAGRVTFNGTDVLKEGATAVTRGSGHGCALLQSGAATCWGDNAFGQLGDGTTASRAAAGHVRF